MATAVSPQYLTKFALDFVPNQAPTERQQETMELITVKHASDADGFIIGMPFANFSDGDGIGPSTGQVLVFEPDTKVHADVDFGPNVFAVTAAARIRDMVGGLTDENIARCMKQLTLLAPTYSPEQLAPSLEVRDPIKYIDKKTWEPELGINGKATIAKGTDGRENSYWAIVHVAPDMISDQIKQMVRNKDMTYEELANNPIFTHAKEMTKRCAQRILADMRSTFRMDMGKDILEDASAVHSECELPPNLLIPDHQHYTSTMHRIVHDGQPCYAVYNDVIPTADCMNRVFISRGPWDGYVVFDTAGTGPALGYPASTRTASHHSTVKVSAEDRQLIQSRLPYFVWEGKPANVEAISTDALPAMLLDNLHENTTDHFMDVMKTLGLKKTAPVAKLLPIAMKISAVGETRARK